MMNKTTDMFVEHSQHDAWHMPLNSLAFATDIVGICHRHHWHLPQTSLAYATKITGIHKELKKNPFFFAISIKHRIFARRKETAKRGCPDSIGILIKLI